MSLIAEYRTPSFSSAGRQWLRADDSSINDARWAGGMIGAASLICFVVGWLRYIYFRAGVSDIGIFDQACFLISRGRPTFVPILGYPILADHAAFLLYPLALSYVIYPSILWLIATQSVALAISGWYIWRLARQAGVLPRWSLVLCGAWLAYPALAIPNLRDFHPEILAVTAILAAVFYARDRRPICFLVCVIIALGTKEVVAVTVAAMGLWLFLSEKAVFSRPIN
jgi:uncharacterized membrane protein